MSTPLATFLAGQVAEFEPLNTQAGGLYWEFATTGRPDAERRLGDVIQRLRLMSAEPERLRALRRLMQDGVADPLIARQATLFHNALRGNQITPDLIARMTELELKIQSAFTNFRANVGGAPMADNDLKKILRESDDAALRIEAWQASKQIGAQVAEDVRELARARNRAARLCGFDNYYTMQMELQELTEAEVFGLFDELRRGTDAAWAAYKGRLDAQLCRRFGIHPRDLRPWHYADPFFQDAQPSDVNLDRYFAGKDLEQLTRDYFGAIGLDIDDILARSDLYEREGKEQHAFCTHIDKRGDVRVLCNNRSDETWAETMLHEFGHAVYDKYIDRSLPYLLRDPAHTLTTEAIAILSGGMVRESAWLERFAGVPRDEAQALEAELREADRTARLIFSRWVYVMCHFERALYRDPEQDLNGLWWDCVERFQWVKRPDGRDAPDWAAKIHIGTAPVYYHSYLMGAMIAWQLRDTLLNEVAQGDPATYAGDTRIGRFLVERAFAPGSVRDWRGWLLHATGKRLGAGFYADLLSGRA